MKRVVPILWYVLAGLVLVTTIGMAAYSISLSGMPGMAIARIFPTIGSVLALVAAGLAYHLMAKTTDSTPVSVLGLIHWVFVLIAQIFLTIGASLQDRMMINGDRDIQSIAAVYAGSGIANLIGGLLFIIALIVAINSTTTREPYAFD